MKQWMLPLLLLSACTAAAQIVPQRSLDNNAGGSLNDVLFTDNNGIPFKSYYDDVEGSPYFTEAWKYGNIVLAQGKKFESIRVKIDVCNQQVHFITANNIEMVTPAGFVKEIIINDTTKNGIDTFYFKTGYPAMEELNSNSFYRVVSRGKLQLLQSVRKKIISKHNDISGETTRAFETYEDYWGYNNGSLVKIKNNKAAVLSLMADKKKAAEDFAEMKKINFKKLENLRLLFDYYNTL